MASQWKKQKLPLGQLASLFDTHTDQDRRRTHKKFESWLRVTFEGRGVLQANAGAADNLLLDGSFAALLHRDASYIETAGEARRGVPRRARATPRRLLPSARSTSLQAKQLNPSRRRGSMDLLRCGACHRARIRADPLTGRYERRANPPRSCSIVTTALRSNTATHRARGARSAARGRAP